MGCPECQCEEISVSGTCLWCGYQAHGFEEEPEYPANAGDLQSTQELVDEMTSEHSIRFDALLLPEEDFIRSSLSARYYRDPALLSVRTLSGLIDLGIMALSAGPFILAAYILSGVRVLDSGSVLHYSLLFLLVYFLYSLIFLGVSNQTIGMMLMNLRVTNGTGEMRPRPGQIFVRCCLYLVSLLCMGTGLVWALFDREQRCFHDRLTNTRIIRI